MTRLRLVSLAAAAAAGLTLAPPLAAQSETGPEIADDDGGDAPATTSLDADAPATAADPSDDEADGEEAAPAAARDADDEGTPAAARDADDEGTPAAARAAGESPTSSGADADDEIDDTDANDLGDPTGRRRGGLVEELTYEQYPGLPPAASKIFFTDQRYAISGFGELAYIHYFGDKNRSSGDIELFNTNLYRFVLYGAYRPADWLVLYAEVFAEFFHDGLRQHAHEVFLEAFVDFVISRPFSLRVGWFQVPIGYVNNNDEPIMYYSVNRPEVERLIIPSQWIDLGVQAYGHIGQRANWLLAAFQGVDGHELIGASWIRRGREMRFNFDSLAVAGQVNVFPVEGLALSVSGLYMQSGNNAQLDDGSGETTRVTAPTGIVSAYARYEHGPWSAMVMGTLGWMGQTDRMYDLTRQGDEGPQVLGARTYGYYFELGFDLLHYAPVRRRPPKRSLLWRTDEMRLPVFIRYERLDTHDQISGALADRLGSDDLIFRSDLDILTFGLNYNLRKNFVLKMNYQVRRNRARAPHLATESNRFESGIGFIF